MNARRTRLLQLCTITVAASLVACSGSDSSPISAAAGGSLGAGGTVMGGAGGAASGGAPASRGGALSGGAATGGTSNGGAQTSTGGVSNGGAQTSTGGVSTSGALSGGASTGGKSTGGAATGGALSGGAATGGALSGGASTGGARASGGAATGGARASGGGSSTGGTAATTGGTTGACTVGPPLSGGTAHCANGLGSLGNGYNWEVWMASGSGTNCGTMYGVGAAFRADWALGSSGDFLARAGLFFGATKPHDQVGTISADYGFTKLANNGFSWVAIYGWTFSNLAEYYIVEDWSVNRPGVTYTSKGTLTVDGGTYDIYYNRRVGAVSPQGTNTDFDQFWSVRRQGRQCGHVSISEHFKQWQSLGMNMTGLLRESMVVVEALNGSGTVDFASATVQVN